MQQYETDTINQRGAANVEQTKDIANGIPSSHGQQGSLLGLAQVGSREIISHCFVVVVGILLGLKSIGEEESNGSKCGSQERPT